MTKTPFSFKAVQFFYSIGLPPARIAQCAVGLLLAAVFVYWVFQPADETDDKERKDVAEIAPVVDEPKIAKPADVALTVDQQIINLALTDTASNNYVYLASEIQQRNGEIEALRQREDLTQAQKNKLDQIQLGLQILLVEKMIEKRISYTAEEVAFKKSAEILLNSPDQDLQNFAGNAVTYIAARKFSMNSNEENFESAMALVRKHQQAILIDKNRCDALLDAFLVAWKRAPKNPFANQSLQTIGEIYSRSDSQATRTSGTELQELVLFADFDLPRLEEEIRFRDRNSMQQLDDILRVLEKHPEVTLKRWKKIMQSYEAFVSTNQIENTQTAINIMDDLTGKLPDSDERKQQLQQLLERQKTRILAIGKPFDVTGIKVTGGEILPSANEYTVLLFADRTVPSKTSLEELTRTNFSIGAGMRPIIAFKDPFAESDKDRFREIPANINVADHETAKSYLAKYPVDFFPTLILIDKQGTIACGNLSLLQAQNRIASFESRERQQNNQ